MRRLLPLSTASHDSLSRHHAATLQIARSVAAVSASSSHDVTGGPATQLPCVHRHLFRYSAPAGASRLTVS